MAEKYSPEPGRGWAVESVYGSNTRVAQTLALMAETPDAPGHSDIGARNLVYTFVINLRPRRVLEVGTHIGSCAIVIGSALNANGYGKLFTLEPQPHYQKLALQNIERAGLSDRIEIIPYFSFDEKCMSILQAEAPFEVIFIDGAHEYDAAYHDIEFCTGLLAPNGIMIMHDVGRVSAEIDTSGKGGVRKALYDFGNAHPQLKVTFLEHPLWPNPCGLGILSNQAYDPPMV